MECKDKKSGEVGQDVLDHLVGVIAQLDADNGAVITTRGYTAGAAAVAADEDITLLRLRPYDRENPEPFVKKISLNIVWIASTQAEINVAVAADALPASAAGAVAFYTGTNLLNPTERPRKPSWTCSRRTRRRSGPSRAATRAR